MSFYHAPKSEQKKIVAELMEYLYAFTGIKNAVSFKIEMLEHEEPGMLDEARVMSIEPLQDEELGGVVDSGAEYRKIIRQYLRLNDG